MTLPFFPPDLFESERDTLLSTVYAIGTCESQRFILGEHTARLERALGERLDGAEVIACGSGTSALTLILQGLGIRPGDEVVVPAFGCAPLASTVVNLGATPVFADIDPYTMVLDPADVEHRVTPRTKALMPAHMFSVMADMPALRTIAGRHHLHLVEDSAVAQGAVLDGVPAGLWGVAGVYSFVQVKTFGGPGEGGVVVTRDAALATAVRMLRNHGQDGITRFRHHVVGHNSRFDEVLAAFQLHRLSTLDDRLDRRAAIAAYYHRRFAPLAERGVRCPPPGHNGRCYYVYTLLSDRRDALAEHLTRHGVDSHVYYPRPLPHQPAFAHLTGRDGRWPQAEAAARRHLAIPIYPHLSDAQVERIADVVCAFPTEGKS